MKPVFALALIGLLSACGSSVYDVGTSASCGADGPTALQADRGVDVRCGPQSLAPSSGDNGAGLQIPLPGLEADI